MSKIRQTSRLSNPAVKTKPLFSEQKIRDIRNFLLLFGIEFSLPDIGFISYRKVVFILLLLYYLKHSSAWIHVQKNVVLAIGLISLLFMYGLYVSWIRLDEYVKIPQGAYNIKEPILLMLNMVIFPVLLIKIFNDAEDFIRCQWRVILFQSVIIFAGRLIFPIRMFVFMHINGGLEGDLYNGVYSGLRSVGIDMVGAAGSVVLFAGLICGIYLFYQTKDRKKKKKIIIGWMFILAANLFMGRTGLYLSVIALLMVFAHGILRFDKSILWIVIVGSVILTGCFVYIHLASDKETLRMWIYWIMEIGDLFGKTRTLSAIWNMSIPPLTLETLFGTGLYRGITKTGIIIDHDGGYIQAYASIGLIGCTLYYGLIYGVYLSMINKVKSRTKKWIYFFALLAVAICEMKEPFFRKTPLILILSCMLLLETRQTAKNI